MVHPTTWFGSDGRATIHRIMVRIDAALLDLTERLCRRFQLLTGRTNVWLAGQLTNLSIVVYFLWAAILAWDADLGPRLALGLFCGVLLYGLSQTILRVPIEAYEERACERVAKGIRNPRRVRDALLRIPFLTLSVVLVYPVALVYVNLGSDVALLGYSLIMLTTVVLYVLACDPLPPCTGTVQEWLQTFAARPRRAEVRADRQARRP